MIRLSVYPFRMSSRVKQLSPLVSLSLGDCVAVSFKWVIESGQSQATRSGRSGVRYIPLNSNARAHHLLAIEVDDDSAPYAVAGQNVTLYLSGIDPVHLAIGSVLCPTSKPVPLVTRFTAQILVFDLQSPIITGTAVWFFARIPQNTELPD